MKLGAWWNMGPLSVLMLYLALISRVIMIIPVIIRLATKLQ